MKLKGPFVVVVAFRVQSGFPFPFLVRSLQSGYCVIFCLDETASVLSRRNQGRKETVMLLKRSCFLKVCEGMDQSEKNRWNNLEEACILPLC